VKLGPEKYHKSLSVSLSIPCNDATDSVFEGGVFRPIGDVTLPEKARVEFEPRLLGSEEADPMLKVFEILSESFDSGQGDLAARHNEHQP
jgi:predicted DNA-binding antitoxin AbrB/MazE fold protein